MKILVYEHVSGGGYADQPIDQSVLAEGFAMLRTFTAELTSTGHEVTVFLDSRISKLNPPITAQCIVPIAYATEAEKLLAGTSKINDATYVIAPETGQTLQSLVKLVEKTGKVSLNCSSISIGKVADKTILFKMLEKEGLQSPQMMVFKFNKDVSEVKTAIKRTMSYPLVVKPAEGVSCSGISLIKEPAEMEASIAKARIQSRGKQFVVQKFIEGDAASVSVLCGKGGALAISLNKQNIHLASPETASSYDGGAAPFDHPLKQKAFEAAEKLVASVAGLRGYVGVDLVLGDEPFVVDVNPRLTTSYVGLSKVTGFNVADTMVNVVLKKKLLLKKEGKGFAYFSKVGTSKPTASAFQRATQINEVVSPPFPMSNIKKAIALIRGQGDTMEEAQSQFEEAKSSLLNSVNGER